VERSGAKPPLRAKRTTLARIDIGNDELVVTLDERDRLDVRVWTTTAGVSASPTGM
jgi:hypothetical protein